MSPSLWQILVVLMLVVLLFGRGKISDLMGDVAKGIKSFKKGMAEDDKVEPAPRVAHRDAAPEAPVATAEDLVARPAKGA